VSDDGRNQENGSADKALLARLDAFEKFVPDMLPIIERTWAKSLDFDRDRFATFAVQIIQRNPAILECETMSIIGAFKSCGEYNLYPDDLRGHVYLVPRYDKNIGMKRCQFMLGYLGLVSLFRRSPFSSKSKAVTAERVYEGDEIKIVKGLHPELEHVPNLEEAGKANRKLRLVYAILHYADGGSDFDFVTAWQIEEVKKHLSESSDSYFSPWKSKSDLVRSWMEKKTAMRQVLKLSPALDDSLAGAVALDEKADARVDQNLGVLLSGTERDVAGKLLPGQKVSVPALPATTGSGSNLSAFLQQRKAARSETIEAEKPEPEKNKSEASEAVKSEAKEREKKKPEPEKPKSQKKDSKKSGSRSSSKDSKKTSETSGKGKASPKPQNEPPKDEAPHPAEANEAPPPESPQGEWDGWMKGE
jgi:recombination protein RecT